MAVFDTDTLDKLKKPVKGSTVLARKKARQAIVAHEKDVKAQVLRRDGARHCRLDDDCKHVKAGIRTEGCHLDDKGMGGDHGVRTSTARMVRACYLHHQGADSLHAGTRRVKYLTAREANGPIALEKLVIEFDAETRAETRRWVEFARERAINVWMTAKELAR